MYRTKLKNLDSGDTILAWEDYSRDDKSYHYYSDIECTQKLDMSHYKAVDEDPDGIPFNLFGIECGKGWIPLIKPIIEYIDDYNKDKYEEEQIHIMQIKEKFGGLRIYVSHGTDELFKMINDAEDESYKTCEFCGAKKDIGQTQGWIITCCRNCCKDLSKERNFGSYRWYSFDDNKTYWIRPDGNEEFICNGEEELP